MPIVILLLQAIVAGSGLGLAISGFLSLFMTIELSTTHWISGISSVVLSALTLRQILTPKPDLQRH